ALESADIALILIDEGLGIGEKEKSILSALPREITKLWIHNKIDLTHKTPEVVTKDNQTHIYLSAKEGTGVDLLKKQLLSAVGWQPVGEGAFMARSRHLSSLTAVKDHLTTAINRLGQPELVAEELRQAQDALNTITGRFTPDDLLGEIFSRFCIGK
ncbi:MAG TPA: tRNA uridine-5-carboxymethylaminomethyl(34) synthesis GTPase MnmE, partial [Methylophilaceae bacterium]|nr:tRNA uridine-5-carboxymethylaminomethyl(34) synthesis GTPase MnmE [Methylophilaceae bacterium]